MRRVAVLALDGVFDSSLALTLDVLAAANRLLPTLRRPPAFSVRTLGVGSRRVRTGAGLALSVQGVVERAGDCDLVVVPGLNTGVHLKTTENCSRVPAAAPDQGHEHREHKIPGQMAGRLRRGSA